MSSYPFSFCLNCKNKWILEILFIPSKGLGRFVARLPDVELLYKKIKIKFKFVERKIPSKICFKGTLNSHSFLLLITEENSRYYCHVKFRFLYAQSKHSRFHLSAIYKK